jgi:hypothetical protein
MISVMFKFFKKKNPKSIVKKQIKSGMISAEQVIKELPETDLEKMGGITGLLDQTKTNIADSLSTYGFTYESRIVISMDTKSFSNINQFERNLCQAVGVC